MGALGATPGAPGGPGLAEDYMQLVAGGLLRQSLQWFVLHSFIRSVARLGARRGHPQARLIVDPAVTADPVAFYAALTG